MRRWLAILAVVACHVAAGGCAPSPSPAPITRSSATGDQPFAVGGAAGNGWPAAARPVVVVVDAAFQPATITVKAGQTVTWVNKDRIAHRVTADRGGFDTPLKRGGSWQHRFAARGTVAYACRIHPANPFMHGQVVVS